MQPASRDPIQPRLEGPHDDLDLPIQSPLNKHYDSPLSELPSPPVLPQTPTKPFSREEIVNEVLDLTDQIASAALFGPVGVGKSFVAHTLLHHNKTQARFGRNRHIVRCDDLTSSLESFLERLSDVIDADRTANTAQVRSLLEFAPPTILLLDGVDLIIDPQAPEAKEISATIEELGSYPHICLVTTSRMNPEIRGFHRLEVPIPSEYDARDMFYSLCNVGRSSAVDELIARLAFHPLSIDLFARSVCANDWDESALLKAMDDDRTGVLMKNYYGGLKAAMGLSFRSPTIQSLGTAARGALEAIAGFPCGIKEHMLEANFPGITATGATIDVLCKFSLIYRQDGFVKMLSPFQFYFLESALVPAQHVEVIRWGVDCSAARGGVSISRDVLFGRSVTLFEVFPVHTDGPYPRPTPPRQTIPRPTTPHPTTPHHSGSPRGKWVRRFESVKRSKNPQFCI